MEGERLILVGLNYKWTNGYSSDGGKILFEAKDIHEAAVETLKASWTTNWQHQRITGGEFHDTETLNTWSVDNGGHTQRDYRKEKTENFKTRWRDKSDPKIEIEGFDDLF